jgi:dihydrofolate reductase
MLEVLAQKSEKFQGLVYVLGGKSIYDYFLNHIGYDIFKLTVEHHRQLGNGISLFSHPLCSHNPRISGKNLSHTKLLNDKGTEQIIFVQH